MSSWRESFTYSASNKGTNMKLLIVILSVLMVTPAFATHSYRDVTCKSSTHTLIYIGNYPVGGPYKLAKLDTENSVEIYAQDEVDGPGPEEKSFEVVTEKLLVSNEVAPSCDDEIDFVETYTKKESSIRFTRLSPHEETLLDLKSGDVMTFSCEEVVYTPFPCD